MAERDDCVDRVVRASGGRLSREKAMDFLEEIDARAESAGPSSAGMGEKLSKAAAELEDKYAEAAAVARRKARVEAIKEIDAKKYIKRAPTVAQGLEALFGGVNTPFAGSRLSVDAQYNSLKRELLGGMMAEMQSTKTPGLPDGGLEKLFLSQSIERKWMKELHEINKLSGGKPGVTGDKEALAIAEIIQRWQGRSIERMNQEGAWVKSYSGYITRTSHDSDRIRRAGMSRWIDDTMKHLDVERTFGSADPAAARKHLETLYPQFVTGDHLDYSHILDDADSILLDVDFAKKVSAHRELHWKDADSWADYNQVYGRFSPTFAITHALENAARVTALMGRLGPRPTEMLNRIIRDLKGELRDKNSDGYRELAKKEQFIRNLLAQFDGTAAMPVNATMATIGADIRAVGSMSKLGMTPFAMLADLATKASELRYQGMSFPERFGAAMVGYVKEMPDEMGRSVAALIGHSMESEIGQINRQLSVGGNELPSGRGWEKVHNAISRAEKQFFRLTLMNAMTFNQRHHAERVMAEHFGGLRGTAFDALPEAERRMMTVFDIGKPEWDALHKVEWNDVGGTTYFTPDIAKRLSDQDVKAYLIEAGRLHKNAGTGEYVDFSVKKARDDLSLKIASYFADRGQYAVLEPGAREKAMLFGGAGRDWARGTVKGEAWRMFMQFKTFTATMLMKTWGREIYGGQGTAGAAAGVAEFVVYATALGIMANAMNQLAKGQDPTSRWKEQPGGAILAGFIRGGAGAIYGDFLLGEWSRHGQSLLGTLAGPTFGQLETAATIWSDITHAKDGHWKAGHATAGTALKLVRDNTPFANMIYTKYAVDALIYWRMAEWISPGFLDRHERTMKDKQGIKYIDELRPTRVAR
jgi:hypothetical protein